MWELPHFDYFPPVVSIDFISIYAAFSITPYKDSQCLCGFQQNQKKNEKNFRSTTRVIPRKLKIIEKKFAIYFWPCLTRVSEGCFFESPVNTNAVELKLNLELNLDFHLYLQRQKGTMVLYKWQKFFDVLTLCVQSMPPNRWGAIGVADDTYHPLYW